MNNLYFDTRVPQFPGDQLSTTQPQLQLNMQKLFEAFARNHVSINDANAGNHTFLKLIEQMNPIQTNVSEISIYTKNVEGQTDQVFFRYQGNGQEFQFTNYQIYKPDQKSTSRSRFFTFLPGKIILYFGSFFNNKRIEKVSLAPPVSTKIMTVNLCPFRTTVPTTTSEYNSHLNSINKNKDGLIESLTFQGFASGSSTNRDSYYIILGNIGV